MAGSGISKELQDEKTKEAAKWDLEHSLAYDEEKRQEQMELLKKVVGPLQLMCIERELCNGQKEKYQEWYATDKAYKLVFEPSGFSIMKYDKDEKKRDSDAFQEKTIVLDREVRERITKLCGATAFSHCLRNSEHAARYIFAGAWNSRQMIVDGKTFLAPIFMQDMKNHHKAKLNSPPEELVQQAPISHTIFSAWEPPLNYVGTVTCMSETDLAQSEKNIVLIGPTGAGKSRLINILFNKTLCRSRDGAQSVTKHMEIVKGTVTRSDKYKRLWESAGFKPGERVNVIDTVGFVDSVMKPQEVLDLVKSYVKANSGVIHKVIVVCHGRIESAHSDSIKNFLSWLTYEKYKKNFLFILNKTETQTDEEKESNLSHMAELLGIDGTVSHEVKDLKGANTRVSTMQAVGFPPCTRNLSNKMKTDLERFSNCVLEGTDAHIPVSVREAAKGGCAIL